MSNRSGLCRSSALLTEAYEQMRSSRRSPFDPRPGTLGCGLLIQRGLTAWIEAWSSCTQATVTTSQTWVAGTRTPQEVSHPDTSLPASVNPALTRLLAGMAMGQMEEVLS